MKRIVFSLMTCTVLFMSCKDAPEADTAEASEAVAVDQQAQTAGSNYTVDPAQSKVEWVGTKPTGRHHGTFVIKEGNLAVANNNITGGKIVIDINSIQPDDQDAEGNAKLQGHLKSADFFDAAKYPEGVFEIVSVTAGADNKGEGDTKLENATHTITGNLKLKDITKSISFPAAISMSGTQITADANFNIDRTQWGMHYGEDKSLGDKFIRHEVNIKLHVVANGQ
jgi:polyisoprenoid-binding protein YceI